MDKLSGRAAGRPRRLRIRTDKPPSPAASAIRKGAGDGVAAKATGRHSQVKVGPPSAAACKRRSALASMPAAGQARTPAKPPQASSCSQHQAACWPARITTRRSSASPAATQAGACGNQGGATSASQPPSADNFAKAGNNRLISPRPLRSTRISVKFPCGQPPPGNSTSSSGWPLEMAFPGKLASMSPRQISPRASTSAKACGKAARLIKNC